MFILRLVFVLLLLSAAICVAQQPDMAAARVLYTGNLFGYLRIPDRQPVPPQSPLPCNLDSLTVRGESAFERAAQGFLRDVESKRANAAAAGQPIVLLGAGDNFSPELGSRVVFNQPANPTDFTGFEKKELRPPLAVPRTLCEDNVAAFLWKAHYNALVPGKEDFYFGAERLHAIANLLHDQQIAMLGANLIIQTIESRSRVAKPRGFLPASPDVVTIDLPDDILPSLRSFKVSVKPTLTYGNVRFCVARFNDPDDLQLTTDCTTLNSTGSSSEYSLNGHVLEPGRSYGICVDVAVPGGPHPYCQQFKVARPFFQDPWWLNCPQANQCGTQIAVFGLLDQDLRSNISKENSSWGRIGDIVRAEIKIIPPEEALGQILEAFYQEHPNFHGIKILLAQMTPARSLEIAARLRCPLKDSTLARSCQEGFDLVVSRAQESQATQTQSVINSNLEYTPSMVLTPRPISTRVKTDDDEERQSMIKPVGELTIERDWRAMQPKQWTWKFTNSVDWGAPEAYPFPAPPARAPGVSQLEDLARLALLAGTSGLPLCQPAQHPQCDQLQLLTLQQMREHAKADVALLQLRDFWPPALHQFVDHTSLQWALDRVLWKDDLLATVNLTGAQIKELLAQSRQQQEAEHAITSTVNTPDTELFSPIIGLLPFTDKFVGEDNKDKRFVNDEDLDDSRIYRVATSDYLASGETGFAAFAKPAVGEQVIEDKGGVVPISHLVCRAIVDYQSKFHQPGWSSGDCGHVPDHLNASVVPSNWLPTDTRPFQNVLSRLGKGWRATNPLAERPSTVPEFLQRNNETEPFWVMNLVTLEGSYKESTPNRRDVDLSKRFSGVIQPAVSQAHTNSFEVKNTLRILRQDYQFDVGFEQSADISRTRQGNTDGTADTITTPFDEFVIGPVLQYHRHVYRPRFSLVFRPGDFRIQPYETNFRLTVQGKPSFLPVRRSKSVATKFGVRYERDADTYLEMGGQLTQDFDVLRSLVLSNGTECSLSSGTSIPDCLKQQAANLDLPSLPVEHGATFHQSGVYWTGNLKLPLLSKISYSLQLKGDFFANRKVARENSALTRYDLNISNGVEFPLVGNLSFKPTVGWFLYQNKVLGNTLTRRSYDLILKYSFDRHSRVRLLDAAQYEDSQSN